MLYLDFETRSTVDIKKRGLWNYIYSPTTSVICMSYAIDDDPVSIWIQGQSFPLGLPFNGRLSAHNYRFEQSILSHFFGIETELKQWLCTMALARSFCLPGDLASMGKFLNHPKLDQRALKKLSKPRSIDWEGNAIWWEYMNDPKAFDQLYDYCKRDTEVARHIHQLFGDMDSRERKIWAVTRDINNRGFKVDAGLIPRAQMELQREARELGAEFKELTGGLSPDQTVAVARWAGMPSIAKDKIRDALAGGKLSPEVERAFVIRQTLGKKSISKLKTLPLLLNSDGRVRDSIPYAAAEKTKRWAGRGFQPQNLPRGSEDEESETINNLLNGQPLEYPHSEISDVLKRFLIGPFYCGDYSQIETRTLAWIAGQEDLLGVFRTGGDPYKVMAAETYKIPVSEVTKQQRFMGKQQILSLGYNAGAVGFMNMLATIYDVHLTQSEAQGYVDIYRNKYRKIVRLWNQLDKAMRAVIVTRKPLHSKRISIVPFAKKGIAIELPSGSKIYYHRAQVIRGSIYFYGRVQGTAWGMIKTYGGKIAENICQSISRDVIAEAIIRMRKWPIVLLVHDEVVSEKYSSLKEFKRLMEVQPEWAKGLPISVDAKEVSRYHK